jgi:hypothetical protein
VSLPQIHPLRRSLILACGAALIASSPAGARTPGYTTPGYHPPTAPPSYSPAPGKPIVIDRHVELNQLALLRPHAIVDGAGTAHITFSSPQIPGPLPDSPPVAFGLLHYCRLPRGSARCDVDSAFRAPNDQATFDGGYGLFPLAIGNQLALLDHREGDRDEPVMTPDGATSSFINLLYTSEDGGASFTGPGIVGTEENLGGVAVYGGANPQIGIVGQSPETQDVDHGSNGFQGTGAGTFTGAYAHLSGGVAIHTDVAVDRTRPVVSQTNFTTVTVHEYRGSGDVNDAANWTTASLPGTDPFVAAGPRGVYLAYERRTTARKGLLIRVVQRMVNGRPAGAPVHVAPGFGTEETAFTEAPNGELIVAWIPEHGKSIEMRTSSDGRHWSATRTLDHSPHEDHFLGLELAAGPGGGGVAVYTVPNHLTSSEVVAAPFGDQAPTGKPGLGNATPQPAGSATCSDVRFGAVHAHVLAGCFERDPVDPASHAELAAGPVVLNGLTLTPDPGTKIGVDPFRHTIDTYGDAVTVTAQSLPLARTSPEAVTLWHGSLDANLGRADGPGQTLFPLPMSEYQATIKGFPALGTLDVTLAAEGATIPFALGLHSYLGAVTGQGTLRTTMTAGLDRSSLAFAVPDITLGAGPAGLEMRAVAMHWAGTLDEWAGDATLDLPPATGGPDLPVALDADHGDFTLGAVHAGFNPPVPVFGGADLANLDAIVDPHPTRRLAGTVRLGAIRQGDGHVLSIDGPFTTAFGNPSSLTVTGSGTFEGLTLNHATATIDAGGHLTASGDLSVNLGVAQVSGRVSLQSDVSSGVFTGSIAGSFVVLGQTLNNPQVTFSNRGLGACAQTSTVAHLGFTYEWSGGASIDPGLGGCDAAQYTTGGSRSVLAHVASAGFNVPRGAPFVDLLAAGAGGVPSVVLRDPAGRAVVPGAGGAALAIASKNSPLEAIVLVKPAAGRWSADAAPGSPPLAAIETARGYARPKVTARISGRGRRRTLRYAISGPPGMRVRFAEIGARRALHVLGTTRGTHGTLRFAPGAGRAGTRRVLALADGPNQQPAQLTVARYTAPRTAAPGRPKLSIGRHERRVTIRVARVAGAVALRLRVVASDGRRIDRLLPARGGHLRLTVLGWSDHFTATATAVGPTGVAGRSARRALSAHIAAPRLLHAARRR